MAAYVISDVDVVDEVEADRYRELAAASIERYGGRYLVRGASPEAVEGVWQEGARMVIVEFPDMRTLRDWYASPEYAEALKLSWNALDRRLLFVDGVPPQESSA